MRTAARYALSFGAASVLCFLAIPVVVHVLSPFGTVLDAVSERWSSSLLPPETAPEPAKDAPPQLPDQPASCDIDPALSAFEGQDPIEMAKIAIREGNLDLLGVASDGVHAPGHSDDRKCWAARQGVLRIPGTTDDHLCSENARLQGIVESFAAKYNDFLIEHLRRRFPGSCAA